jgi:hypothetical protein
VALVEFFVSVGVVAVFPYDDALLIFVIPIIFDNSKKTENKSRVKYNYLFILKFTVTKNKYCFEAHFSYFIRKDK